MKKVFDNIQERKKKEERKEGKKKEKTNLTCAYGLISKSNSHPFLELTFTIAPYSRVVSYNPPFHR